MKKKFKIGLGVILALCIIGVGVYSSLQPIEVEVVEAELSDAGIYFIEKGIVKQDEEKLIYTQVNGTIKNIFVKENDVVKKGDILAEIDESDIDFQILSLQSTIDGYEAQKENAEVENSKYILSLENSKKELQSQLEILKTTEKQGDMGNKSQVVIQKVITEQALVQYENAQVDYDKNKILFNNGIISQNEFNTSENYLESCKNEYEKAMLQLETLETVGTGNSEDYYNATYNSISTQINGINNQINSSTVATTKKYYDTLISNANISIEQLKDSKSKFVITSPYDGEIKSVEIENTNVVSTMSPAFIIQDVTNNDIESYVSTRDISSVSVSDTVELIFKNRNGDLSINGQVLEIGDEAVVKLSPLGVEERAVLVKIVPEENDFLKKGYEVDVKYQLVKGDDKIVMPTSAVYKKDGADMVMVVVNGVVTEQEFSKDYDLMSGIAVASGINEGDIVIKDISTKGLKIGAKVNVTK